MERDRKRFICHVMYAVILIAASMPLACNYVPEGGQVMMWLARIEELKCSLQQDHLLMFPSAELIRDYGGQRAALNSDFWLFFPAIIRLMGGSITVAYRIAMLAMQVITLVAAKWMFECLFADKLTALYGTLFYMICPYRIWMCYDEVDVGSCAVWMLIPFLVWGVVGLSRRGFDWKNMLVAVAAFAGIVYADVIMALIAMGILLITALWYKKVIFLAPLLPGAILSLPGSVNWFRYLLSGGMEEYQLPLGTISEKGYSFGEFFASYAYRNGHPGLGIGLLGAILIFMWLRLTDKEFSISRGCRLSMVLSVLFLCMSMSRFPWDLLQRVGAPFLRLIALIGSPTIFFGCASMSLSVLAAYGMKGLDRQRSVFVRVGIAVCIVTASLGVAVYLCNTLIYNRLPMYLPDSLN